jgi:predicted nucleic acid-binding protein
LRVLPDTNVYIRNLAGTLPAFVASLLDDALLWHCSVCLGEITAGIAHCRIVTPDQEDWPLEDWPLAGLISGTLARTQRFQPHQRKECLNDALIYLAAAKLGLPVLTANRDEFDLIRRVAPGGPFLHY